MFTIASNQKWFSTRLVFAEFSVCREHAMRLEKDIFSLAMESQPIPYGYTKMLSVHNYLRTIVNFFRILSPLIEFFIFERTSLVLLIRPLMRL